VGEPAAGDPDLELVGLDLALEKLASAFPRPARVVELRFFGGLEVEETARVLDVAERTVKRDWAFARAWLLRELAGEGGGGSSAGLEPRRET
jgi:DNA-directed RNA polymerase specialized sigma24 family protein